MAEHTTPPSTTAAPFYRPCSLWRVLFTAVLLSITAVSANADSWSYKSSKEELKFSRGLRIVQTVDASKSARSPRFNLQIWEGKKSIAQFPGFAFEDIIESPDGNTFVALSNRGIPGTAAAVFSRDGSLALLALHGLAKFDYCRKSVTLARHWYDPENPNVRFDGPDEAGGITVRDCRGQQVSLFPVVVKAYERALLPPSTERR